MKKKWYALVVVIILIIIIYLISFFTIKPATQPDSLDFIQLPDGYNIEIFADDLGGESISKPGPQKGVRMLAYQDGIFYATIPGKGQVVKLYDEDGNWEIEKREVLADNLQRPHGIDLHEDYVYIAAENQVLRIKEGVSEKLLDLPPGGHWTRTVKIINNEMYVSIGSTCNVCEEEHEWRASIVKCNLDGTNCNVFASGLRNTVGFIEKDGIIYGTDNGRDLIGNDIPPDEINIIEQNKDYGWPYCYGKKIHDDDFDKNNIFDCTTTEPSLIDLQAHSAPLGLAFYNNDLLVAYHGSWNRQPPTGYKIVQINLQTKQIQDFATGWLDQTTVHGRPVDILIVKDSILVSDDVAGRIYRIYK